MVAWGCFWWCCRLLLDYGADPNAANSQLQTPLHLVAAYGDAELAALLISRGADPKRPDRYGSSFLDYIGLPGTGIDAGDARTRWGVIPRAPMTDPPPAAKPIDCGEDGGYNVGQPPPEPFECDIDQRTDLSPAEYYEKYYLQGRRCSTRPKHCVGIQGCVSIIRPLNAPKANAWSKIYWLVCIQWL